MNIIGQTNIINNINSIKSLGNLPKSIIISGESGSGRHTIYNYICDKFKLEQETITYELSLEILNSMYNVSIPKIYLIDLDTLSENKRLDRFQNTLLKFIEEPPEFAWIVIITHTTNILLETVLNRCRILTMQPYSISELHDISLEHNKNFSDDELQLLKTPANVISLSIDDINEIKKLAQNIIDNMHKANISNALSLTHKLVDKSINIYLFINIFTELLYKYYICTYNNKYYQALILSKDLQRNLYVLNINKSLLIDNYILNLKIILDD